MAKNPKESLFSKTSLERLSSPEQLDVLVQVTTPKGWIALVTIGGLVIAALMWGIFGSIPTTVHGTCVLINTSGIRDVPAPSSGQITDIAIQTGMTVSKGDVIARIEQPELLNKYRGLIQQKDDMAEENKLKDKLTEQKRKNINGLIETLKKKIEAQKELLRDKLITNAQLLSTEQDLATSKANLKELAINRTQYLEQFAELERRIDEMRQQIEISTNVVSPYSGTVLEVKAVQGQLVQAGTPLVNMSVRGNAITKQAVIYVPAEGGKKVRKNSLVQIAPSTVKTEEYGYLLGRVESVADYPATFEGMMKILQNKDLVNTLTKGNAVIEVRAWLIPDPKSHSGLKWTSSGGPPVQVLPGTVGTAKVTVATQRPITLVIPYIKKFLGV